MESVLARHQENPHVLNKAQLLLSVVPLNFQESPEDDNEEDNSSGLEVSQRSEPKAQQLHMAVDPDVMEFVTTTSRHDELKQALAAKKSEINWKPNNKTAVIAYRGEDESDSWQPECIEEVQSYLGKFTTCDVEVNKDFWEVVKTQLPNIRACFGIDPPLVKLIDGSLVARIVSPSSDTKKYEDQLKAKLEEIYREETRKTYEKMTKNIAKERLILLTKMKFAEKLQHNNKELEIKFDTEAEKIYFEGPPQQLAKATAKFLEIDAKMVEKKLILPQSNLKMLASDHGLQRVKCELEKNNVEVVFVTDNEARIVGTSAEHAEKAVSLVSKLVVRKKIVLNARSQHLLETPGWRQLCDGLNIHVYQEKCDTFVSGFREDIISASAELNAYLATNSIRTEQFTCSSKFFRSYLNEHRQEDLRAIETQLVDFEVKIQNGKGDDDFIISGNKEGLKRARGKLDALVVDINSTTLDIKQPGLRKFFSSGKGDRLVKSVEKDHACAIQVQASFEKKRHDTHTGVAEAADSKRDDDDDDHEDRERGTDAPDDDDDGEEEKEKKEEEEDEEEEEEVEEREETDPSAFVTINGQKVSWRAGFIQTEKVRLSKRRILSRFN